MGNFNANAYKQQYRDEHYARIELTLSPEFKEKLQNAAALSNRSTNEYVLRAIEKNIDRDLKLYKKHATNDRDFQQLVFNIQKILESDYEIVNLFYSETDVNEYIQEVAEANGTEPETFRELFRTEYNPAHIYFCVNNYKDYPDVIECERTVEGMIRALEEAEYFDGRVRISDDEKYIELLNDKDFVYESLRIPD